MLEPGTALCLASGFQAHFAHAGLLLEFERAGLVPGRLAGASAGALAGGLWAAGVRGEELRREMLKFGFRHGFFDWGSAWRTFGVASWSYASGFFSGGPMRRRLRRLLGERRIEELREPAFELAVANLSRCRGEIRREGELVDFLVASFSMPLVFTVQRVGGERFLDGGISNEAPFDQWLDDEGIDRILVHRVRHRGMDLGRGWMSPARVIAATHAIANRDLAGWRERAARASGKEVIALETELPHPGGWVSRVKAERMMEAGAATARRWLDGSGG